MAYTSTRLVRRFDTLNPKKIINGAPASGPLFSVIADGQQYLFGNDMPMTNIFSGRGINNKNSIIASGTTVKTFYARILMPPYSSHAEFWFSCAVDVSDNDDPAPGYPYVTVASGGTGGETRALMGLPLTSNEDTSGSIYDFAADDQGMYGTYWVGLFGMGVTAVSTQDPQAVKILTAVTTWTEVTIQIDWRASSTANGKLFMNAAYYRVVPPTIYTL